MNNIKENKKILFIPGWLDSGELHGYKNSLDIWNHNIDIKKNWNADFVIAHSVGSLAALDNWSLYKNFKIILINPVLSGENIFWRWLKTMIREKTHYPPKRIIIFFSVISAALKAKELFKIKAADIINSIPEDQLIVIYGEKDKYLYNREIINQTNKKFKIINLDTSGHNYDADIEAEIINILK